ncbi:thioesterase [Xanthomonas sp. LMG 8992]|uniref:thioesterase II family protein n=1 Tax=Xanthomonas sp. LMG 8992 TaxID=1591157 RepID=UPI0013712233|nr:thioesterase domain-containing protein [Xanthomonas sp. LMG 8992]MXV11616.1 thioesterase [Xanthomonas sp. LMG 8992]
MHHTPWIVHMTAAPPRMRLFCFAYAGGSAFNFAAWRPALHPSVEICALQLPGRGARIAEAPIASMQTLLRAMAPAITQQGSLPFAFFGHSVGALIAFELARYLRLHGIAGPRHLFASGCQAPRFRSPSRQLRQLSDADFIEELRHYNGTPAEVLESRELMSLMLPAIRADFTLAEDYAYRPGPLLQVPLSVYAGRQDDNKGHGQVEGWAKETSAACRTTWFDDGHFFINTQRSAVLDHLNSELEGMIEQLPARSPTTADPARSAHAAITGHPRML